MVPYSRWVRAWKSSGAKCHLGEAGTIHSLVRPKLTEPGVLLYVLCTLCISAYEAEA
jgi:hypothetical protein